MEAMNFQDVIPSVLTDNSKDHHLLVFNLTPMWDATENCHSPQLVSELLRLEQNFTFPVEHVTELIVLKERMFLVAVDEVGGVAENISNGKKILSSK